MVLKILRQVLIGSLMKYNNDKILEENWLYDCLYEAKMTEMGLVTLWIEDMRSY